MNNQLPTLFQDYFVDSHWSDKYVNLLINTPSEPNDYPNALIDLNNCLIELSLDLTDKKILVIGSISPWIECFLLSKNANKVYTTDVNVINIDSEKICFILESELTSYKFDVVVSYSSIEHIGLGRYGDEIDPDGDLKYMNNLLKIIHNNTYLLIGIPVAENYLLEGRWHRIYDEKRIEKLFNFYDILLTSKNGNINKKIDYSFDTEYKFNWQNQPIIVIKKK
jgi:hypothetical protein